MKISTEYVLRDIAGEHIVVPTGAAANQLYGIMTLNESGLLLWNLLAEDRQKAELVDAILGEYEVDAQTAEADVDRFLSRLKQAGVLVGEG